MILADEICIEAGVQFPGGLLIISLLMKPAKSI